MKIVVSISVISILVLVQPPYTASAPTAAAYLPYAYALAHPYNAYPYFVEYPHHHPDHKEDGNDSPKDGGSKEEQGKSADDLGSPLAFQVITPLVYPLVSQFHAQDTLGQYHYGYSSPLSAKDELKTLDGVTRGGYSYVDSNGQLQTVAYVADGLGFRVAATNLPVPAKAVDIPDSPEIAEEKRKLFALQKEAAEKAAASPEGEME